MHFGINHYFQYKRICNKAREVCSGHRRTNVSKVTQERSGKVQICGGAWSGSFMLQTLYSLGKNPQYWLYRWLCEPHEMVQTCWQREKINARNPTTATHTAA
jgi:hypothetical protein